MNLNKIKTLNSKQKIATWSTSTFVLFLIILYFINIPTVANIKLLKKDIIDQKSDLLLKKSNQENIGQLKDDLENIDNQIKEFGSVFINRSRELEFITILEGIAQKNNIEQKISLDPEKGIEERDFIKIKIRIDATGSYQDIISYLSAVESLDYYININQLTLSNDKVKSGSSLKVSSTPDNETMVGLVFEADTYWK